MSDPRAEVAGLYERAAAELEGGQELLSQAARLHAARARPD